MRTFARDSETNDIVFENFASKTGSTIVLDAVVDDGKKGIGDVLEAIVKTEKGELALNTGVGIRHTQLLANGESVLPFWKKDMTDEISGCDYVNSITSFDVDYNREKHALIYELTVDTNDGNVSLSEGSENLAQVVNYGLSPNRPDEYNDATVLKFDFLKLSDQTTDPTMTIRVRKLTSSSVVTVDWRDGTRTVISADTDQTLTHTYSISDGSAEIWIWRGAEWLAVGPSGTTGDPARTSIVSIEKFASTVTSLDSAFVNTSLKKNDYMKPDGVTDTSWNSAFSH